MKMFACLLATLAVLLPTQGCNPPLVELPEVADPLFSHAAGVQLGMSRSEFQQLGRDVFSGPDGNVQEVYGAGLSSTASKGWPNRGS
jgi:hypothetical protein